MAGSQFAAQNRSSTVNESTTIFTCEWGVTQSTNLSAVQGAC